MVRVGANDVLNADLLSRARVLLLFNCLISIISFIYLGVDQKGLGDSREVLCKILKKLKGSKGIIQPIRHLLPSF